MTSPNPQDNPGHRESQLTQRGGTPAARETQPLQVWRWLGFLSSTGVSETLHRLPFLFFSREQET